MGLGIPPKDSSVAEQQNKGLNKDTNLFLQKSEGEKLRGK